MEMVNITNTITTVTIRRANQHVIQFASNARVHQGLYTKVPKVTKVTRVIKETLEAKVTKVIKVTLAFTVANHADLANHVIVNPVPQELQALLVRLVPQVPRGLLEQPV
jgi:hypothetical protein